jgi:hypothetical protein
MSSVPLLALLLQSAARATSSSGLIANRQPGAAPVAYYQFSATFWTRNFFTHRQGQNRKARPTTVRGQRKKLLRTALARTMATAAGNPAATGLPSFDVGESDDFVEYWVHLELPSSETADGTLLRSALQAQCALCLDFVAQWTRSYIWQRDPFVLVPCPAAGTDGRPAPCLYGRSYWGENIDDEWFIVWLLLQMTKRWPSAVVSVVDNDGQFLLIEACEAIPRWIKPDNAAHRVQLAAGSVHLVPLSVPAPLTATAAVAAVRAAESATATLASAAVQQAIAARLRQFEPVPPLLARPQLTHRARLYLPAEIFRILAHHPELVAPAVEAFFARDPIDMRLCNKMAAFPCATRRFGLVTFSRCLYAQLQGQRCTAPRPFGALPPEGSAERKPFELGAGKTPS